MKKMISWNVNGLRACVGKGFLDVFKELDADIFCIQESKLHRLTLIYRATISIGATRTRRDILEPPCLLKRSL